MKTIIKCTVSFCDSETIEGMTDYCWECYDRILENYENWGSYRCCQLYNPQWEDYKLEELEEELCQLKN